MTQAANNVNRKESFVKIMQINARSSNRADEYIEVAQRNGVDILILTETREAAHTNNADAIVNRRSTARIAAYKTRRDLRLTVAHVDDHHIVMKVLDPKIMIHAWYVPVTGNEYARVVTEQLINHLKKGGRNILHTGDMNASHEGLGDKRTTERGRLLMDALTQGDMEVINEFGVKTYYRSSVPTSTIDWTITSQDLTSKTKWTTQQDSYGSDHEQINIEIHADNIRREEHAEMRIKPRIFLETILQLNKEAPLEQWHVNKEIATQKAQTPAKAKQRERLPDHLLDKRRAIDAMIKESTKSEHMRPLLRQKISELNKELARERDQYMKEKRTRELSSTTTADMHRKVKKARTKYIAQRVQVEDTQITGREMSDMILETNFPSTGRSTLTIADIDLPSDVPITATEILTTAKEFKLNSAPGEDGISFELLRAWVRKDTHYFVKLYNAWFSQGKFPVELKESWIKPLIKDPKEQPTIKNIRPIGLLTTISKHFEMIIDSRLMHHAESKGIIAESQHGYREGRSCETALEAMTTWMSNKKGTRMTVQLDVKSAFTMLEHQAIIDELVKMNVPKNTVTTLRDYLEDRRVLMKSEGERVTKSMQRGATQGSALGPHLFILTTNRALKDMERELAKHQRVKSQLVAYADDVIIQTAANTREEAMEAINRTLAIAKESLATVGLELAATKTKVMIHKTPVTEDVNILGAQVETSLRLKILGVTFTQNGTLHEHMREMNAKVDQNIAHYKKTMYTTGVSLSVRKAIAQTRLTPAVTYAANAWYGPPADTHLDKMSKKIARSTIQGSKISHSAAHVLAQMEPLKYQCEVKQKLSKAQKEGWQGQKVEQNLTLAERRHPSEWKQRDEAKTITSEEEVANLTADSVVFTDGSKYQDENTGQQFTGAAFVYKQRDGAWQGAIFKLTANNSSFQAELLAIKEALKHVQNQKARKVSIITDCRAALLSVLSAKPRTKAASECQELIGQLESNGTQVSLHWTKAHAGLKGNEIADEMAKQAAKTGRKVTMDTPRSTVSSSIKKETKAKWDNEFRNSKWGREIKKYVDTPHDPAVKQMHVDWATSEVYGGHGYNMTSHKLGFEEEQGRCPCGARQEMSHVITTCPFYAAKNIQVATTCGLSIQSLLGTWDDLKREKNLHTYIQARARGIRAELKEENADIVNYCEAVHKMKRLKLGFGNHREIEQPVEQAGEQANRNGSDTNEEMNEESPKFIYFSWVNEHTRWSND